MTEWFINPGMLYGLAGIAAPILAHLLNRYRFRKMEWAAMELLRRAVEVRGRQVNIEDWLLLFLRCLAVILIALAFSRPRIKEGAALAGGSSSGVVIAVDASYSMAHRAGVDDRFGLAKSKIKEILKTVPPGSPLTIAVLGQGSPSQLRRIPYRNLGYEPARVEKIVDELRVLPEPLNLEVSLEEVRTLVRELKTASSECYLVTDAQRSTWAAASPKAKSLLTEIGNECSLYFVSCASRSCENVQVARLELHSGFLGLGGMARYAADVVNCGENPQRQVTVRLSVGGKVVDQRVLEELKPGATETAFLFTRFDEAGPVRIVAETGQDSLDLDNSRRTVANVRESLLVLCVNGEPAERAADDETYFIRKALAPARLGEKRSPVSIKTILWHELASEQLDAYDILILANVPDLDPAGVARLRLFLEAGGGLLMLPGDKVVPEVLNGRLRDGGESLLPGALLEAYGDEKKQDNPRHLLVAAPDHPLARALALLPEELLKEALFFRQFGLKPEAGALVILKTTEDGSPLLAEKRLGRGKSLLLTTPADREWSNFPTTMPYPILLNRAVTYLTARDFEQPLTVGEAATLNFPGEFNQTRVTMVCPGGKTVDLPLTRKGAALRAAMEYPPEPGFYEVQVPKTTVLVGLAAAGLPRLLAANLRPEESNVACLQHAEAVNALDGLPLKIFSPGQALGEAITESRIGIELWRYLLLAGLAILLAELLLAHLFARRMQGAASAIPKGLERGRARLNPGQTAENAA